MKKTISITLAVLLTAASSWVGAQQLGGLRGAEITAADQAPEEKAYQGQKPGRQKPIARTFNEQPPLIPHALTNFDEISLEENQCMGCHGPEKAKEKNAPVVGDSHFVTADGKKSVSMMRYQCNNCHVPQVDAKPLVENTFVGNVTPR